MKLDTKGYSRLPILSSAIIFLNFVPKMSFLRKFGPKTSMQSALFRMKIHIYKQYSGMLILNSTIVFKSSTLNYLVWENLVPQLQSALFEMNLGANGYSRVLIPIHPKDCWNQHLWVPLCTYFHSKQTTVNIQDKICPKKVF